MYPELFIQQILKKENFLTEISLKVHNNNTIYIALNFIEKESAIKVGLEKKSKGNLKFYLGIDFIKIKDLMNIWPKNLAISTFDWMNANSSGSIRNVIIDDDRIRPKSFVLKDVKGSFDCHNIEIFYMEGMPSVKY